MQFCQFWQKQFSKGIGKKEVDKIDRKNGAGGTVLITSADHPRFEYFIIGSFGSLSVHSSIPVAAMAIYIYKKNSLFFFFLRMLSKQSELLHLFYAHIPPY
jgi:hypothetical protein